MPIYRSLGMWRGQGNLNVKVDKPDRVVNEEGEHVGTVLTKGLMKKTEIYCFMCDRKVSGLKHYEEEH